MKVEDMTADQVRDLITDAVNVVLLSALPAGRKDDVCGLLVHLCDKEAHVRGRAVPTRPAQAPREVADAARKGL